MCNIKTYSEEEFELELAKVMDYEPSFLPQESSDVLDRGGEHYRKCAIQPVEYIRANNLDYFEGNIVKYISRYKDKNEGKDSVRDLEKIKHYVDMIIWDLQ